MNTPHRFRDRVHAGQLLGAELAGCAGRRDAIALGLPRGGVPVAGEVEACKLLDPVVDDLVVLKIPVEFEAVGSWYEDFTPTTDEEVARLLNRPPTSPLAWTFS